MRIAAARLIPFRLPLARPWRTAASCLTERAGWLLRLDAEDGLVSWGECAPLPEAGTETPAAAEAGLNAWLPQLLGGDVRETLEALAGAGFDHPACRCALETALLDLSAQAAAVPLARFLDPAAAGSVAVNGVCALEGDPPPGFKLCKVKVGLLPPAEEARRLAALAARLPPGGRLRLDANRAWDEAAAARFIAAVAALPVEALEEPLAEPDGEALARLQALAAFPLALDESLPAFDLDALLAAPPVGRLVVKAPARGGPAAAFALARKAQRAGLEVVVTTALDAACGRLAALHLACAVDRGLCHGLATGGWLAADVGEAPAAAAGRMALAATPGLGFRQN